MSNLIEAGGKRNLLPLHTSKDNYEWFTFKGQHFMKSIQNFMVLMTENV